MKAATVFSTGWAHVVCALYIPEVRFDNVTTMEPIVLQLIPQDRYNKVGCIIVFTLEMLTEGKAVKYLIKFQDSKNAF